MNQKKQIADNIQQNKLQLRQIAAQLNALQTQIAAESNLMQQAIASAQADLDRNKREYKVYFKNKKPQINTDIYLSVFICDPISKTSTYARGLIKRNYLSPRAIFYFVLIASYLFL
ncbi:MAG: hypothetical protein RMX68_020590 [Aulosira sp. ZfuVER01]|nr:hypothetical protein [Aulosira sp. ZfuVER01]MDZ8002523.1 hypothetical protein [Aulosira sp. DedVER01a]MDZ8050799.1 hypothetical protein [Aulosira sp. ZfuCHP01]